MEYSLESMTTDHHFRPVLLPLLLLLVVTFRWAILLGGKSLLPLVFSLQAFALQLSDGLLTRLQLLFQIHHYLRAPDLDSFEGPRLVLYHLGLFQDIGLVLLYRFILEEELFFLSIRETGDGLQLSSYSCFSWLLSELWLQ